MSAPSEEIAPTDQVPLQAFQGKFSLFPGNEIDGSLVANTLKGLGLSGVYQRGGKLVMVTGKQDGFYQLSEEAVRLRITETFCFLEFAPSSEKARAAAEAKVRAEKAELEAETAREVTISKLEEMAKDEVGKQRVLRERDDHTKKLRVRRRQLDRAQEQLDKLTADPNSIPLGDLLMPQPKELARVIVNLGDYDRSLVRELKGVRHTPFFRTDGSLAWLPGFDELSGYYLTDQVTRFGLFTQKFSQADAIAAAQQLLEVIVDVPAEDTMRSGYAATAITILAREMFACSPMMLYQANQARVGKTESMASAIEIGTGGQPPPMIPFNQTKDETEKAVRTRFLNASPGPLAVDNVECSRFGSPLINAAISSNGSVEVRHMGRTQGGTTTSGWTICISANNPGIDSDLTQRTLPITIHCDAERPEARSGFRHEPILDYTRLHVVDLTRAALIILLAHQQAGYPQPDAYSWGTFPGWVKYVRAAVMFAGLADPCLGREALIATDPNADFVRVLAPALVKLDPEAKGLTAGQIIDKSHLNSALSEALDLLKTSGGLSPALLSYKLTHIKGRPVDGRVIQSRRGRTGSHVWFAKATAPASTKAAS